MTKFYTPETEKLANFFTTYFGERNMWTNVATKAAQGFNGHSALMFMRAECEDTDYAVRITAKHDFWGHVGGFDTNTRSATIDIEIESEVSEYNQDMVEGINMFLEALMYDAQAEYYGFQVMEVNYKTVSGN